MSFEIEKIRNGIEYEYFCKEILERHGWKVLTTAASGDQGADLVAEKSRRRVVIQCKFYSQPVGNKAVQEVVAAKHFVGATEAVVVTNHRFTPAARQLAKANDVRLHHHNELAAF